MVKGQTTIYKTYTENLRSSNTNPTNNRVKSGAPERLAVVIIQNKIAVVYYRIEAKLNYKEVKPEGTKK